MKKKSELGKLKRRKVALCFIRFFVSVAPIAVAVGLNWNEYTRTVRSGVSLAAGGIIALVLIVLKLLNRMPKKVHGVIKYSIVFIVTYLLKDLLNDAVRKDHRKEKTANSPTKERQKKKFQRNREQCVKKLLDSVKKIISPRPQ